MFFPDVTLALFHTCRILLSRHLHKQLSGEVSSALHGCARVAIHPFLPFYDARLAHLCELMRTAADASLPRGVLHGDPFLDNVLVDPHTGALTSARPARLSRVFNAVAADGVDGAEGDGLRRQWLNRAAADDTLPPPRLAAARPP